MEGLREKASIRTAKDMYKEYLRITFHPPIVFKLALAILIKEIIKMANGVKENLHLT